MTPNCRMVQLKSISAIVLSFGFVFVLVSLIGSPRKIKGINELNKFSISLANYSLAQPLTQLDKILTIKRNSTESNHRPKQFRKNETQPRNFDCSISWVRIPKTASTSIYMLFMRPLETSKAFATTRINAHTCVTGPGGCDQFWNGGGSSSVTLMGNQTFDAPPYGREFVQTDEKSKNATSVESLVSDRCFHSSGHVPCIEYNIQTNTMNYGPKPDRQNKRNEKEASLQLQRNSKNQVVSADNTVFSIHPDMTQHVGLDVSLFGWLMPSRTMVYGAFRDPVERLMSSFHYGISYGANRPGQVKPCHLPGKKQWKIKVASAKANNTEEYNSLMRTYLNSCVDAIDNTYVAFLDPLTKNVSVALDHLEKYLIVGLTSDISETLERWKNLTLRTCRGHEKYQWIRRALTNSVKNSDKRFNEGLVAHKGNGNLSSATTTFKETKLDTLDADLKDLVQKYTAGDEIIYRRVLELYEEQRSWGL